MEKKGVGKGKTKEKICIVPSPNFSIESIISQYSGNSKVSRLLFVAERISQNSIRMYEEAMKELKQSKNTQLYRSMHKQLFEKSIDIEFDGSWADDVDTKENRELMELEEELSKAKTNLVRDEIREAYMKIGRYQLDRGDYHASLRSFIRGQEYCSPDYMLEVCINVIDVSLAMGNFAHVLNYVGKAESSKTIGDHPELKSKLKAAAALAHLENKKYQFAAKKFVEAVNAYVTEDVDSVSDFLSLRDMAMYGSLCGLAEYSREDIKNDIIDGASYESALELLPNVLEMVRNFNNSHYAKCFSHLDQLKNDLKLDIHLHDHIDVLIEKIRNKAVIQYFTPYKLVDLNRMASAFEISVDELEKSLAELIGRSVIPARIDSFKKRLVRHQENPRAKAFQKTEAMGEKFQRDIETLLVHINLVSSNMSVKGGGKTIGGMASRDKGLSSPHKRTREDDKSEDSSIAGAESSSAAPDGTAS